MTYLSCFRTFAWRRALCLLVSLLGLTPTLSLADEAAPAAAPVMMNVTVCIFDPLGKSGPAYANAKEYMLDARKWGVNATLRAYTDEGVLADEFKAGQCDGIAVTTLRAKRFNFFVGSLDAVGAVPDATQMRMALTALADPKLASLMVSGPYEVAGIVPLGAAYVMVRDRSINSVERAAGKKVAVLDWDKSQARMVQQMGAQAVASDITNFFSKFNNGQVDIIAAPAVAFKPLELYRGIGTTGGIYRFPLINVSSTLLIRTDRFPVGTGQKLRSFIVSQVGKAFDYIDREERNIDPKYWMDVSPADKTRYVEMMRQARITMVASGDYDPRMLKLLKRIRCKQNASMAECNSSDE